MWLLLQNPAAVATAAGAFDHVIDAVGARATRNAAFEAIKPGGVIMHIGLQDWASEIDMRRLTLAEVTLIGTYTYTTADLRATVAAGRRGRRRPGIRTDRARRGGFQAPYREP